MSTTKWVPHDYQKVAQDYANMPASGLFLDPGLGKTSIILSTMKPNTLVIAPKVLLKQTWMEENEKWGFGLDMVVVEGSSHKRNAILKEKHDVYLINPELIPWLSEDTNAKNHVRATFDHIVVDESTRFKGYSSQRFKALAKMIWKQGSGQASRTIMTGTPIAKNVTDMWSQMYLLDKGERLGETITKFRRRFCEKGGFKGREWLPKPGAAEEVAEICSDLLLRMDNELLDMPELVTNDIMIPKPKGDFAAKYKMLKEDLLYGGEMSASPGVAYGRLRQLTSGAIYTDDEGNWDEVHDEKLLRLEALVEELNGKPLLVAYHFKHDRERLLMAFPDAPVIDSWETADKAVAEWNKGLHKVMLIQPASCAYGLNLQDGGCDLCWFTLTNSAEQYNQTNARLFRQGQSSQVRIHRLLMKGTVDIATRSLIESKQGVGNVVNSTIKLMRENDNE